ASAMEGAINAAIASHVPLIPGSFLWAYLSASETKSKVLYHGFRPAGVAVRVEEFTALSRIATTNRPDRSARQSAGQNALGMPPPAARRCRGARRGRPSRRARAGRCVH